MLKQLNYEKYNEDQKTRTRLSVDYHKIPSQIKIVISRTNLWFSSTSCSNAVGPGQEYSQCSGGVCKRRHVRGNFAMLN